VRTAFFDLLFITNPILANPDYVIAPSEDKTLDFNTEPVMGTDRLAIFPVTF